MRVQKVMFDMSSETSIQIQKTEQYCLVLVDELILIYMIQMKWDQGYSV